MNIINNSESFRLYDLNHYDDYYFADLNAYAHQFRGSIVSTDRRYTDDYAADAA